MTIYLTILGTLLLLCPFLLLSRFENKRIGFCYILSFVLAFHLTVAVATQALHIFTYSVILALNLVVCGFVAYATKPWLSKRSLKNFFSSGNWMLLFVLFVAFIYLYSVHYNYTGKSDIAVPPYYEEVENMHYPYPYFADEWFSIAFIQDSISSRSLPIVNPLTPQDTSFINLQLPFHSFLAGIILLLQLNPLTQYTLLTIFAGMLTLTLIYLFLRQNNVNNFSAAIVSVSTLYITNGGALPGIWNLIPLNLGIIAMLLGFIFLSAGARMMTFFMSLITFIFYPPLFVFYTAAVFSFALAAKALPSREKIKTILYYTLIVFVAGGIVSIAYFLAKGEFGNFIAYVFSKVFYPTPTPGAIPHYALYNIIPIPILLLALAGIYPLLKKRIWFLATIAVGLAYWILYFFVTFRFIIGYERVIIATSILITVAAGFGLGHLIKLLKKTSIFQKNNFLTYIQVGVLLLFLFFSHNFTEQEDWRKLTLVNFETGKTYYYSAPANKYLHPDDLKLFQDIEGKNFLSLPWKGTVIGVATPNYPVAIKGGTISMSGGLSYEFIQSNCNDKTEIARSKDIHYIYLPEFDCPNFEFVVASSEDLYLYRFSDFNQ